MANAKYVLEKFKLNGVMGDLLAKTNGENVQVMYNGASKTLSAALAEILASVTNLPTAEGVDSKISAAISALVNGAPETADTLKELADLISSNSDAMELLNSAIGGKASASDLTAAIGRISTLEGKAHQHANKEVLDGITEAKMSAWDGKADKTVASASANGLMSKEDKARLDGIRGVRFGAEAPADMQDGELFVHIVE